MILAQWYFSDKIVLWTSGAKIVSKDEYPKLHEIIERLASENGIPKPKVAVVNTRYLMPLPQVRVPRVL